MRLASGAFEDDLMESDFVELEHMVEEEFIMADHRLEFVENRLAWRILTAMPDQVIVDLLEHLGAKLFMNELLVALPLLNDGVPAVNHQSLFLFLQRLLLEEAISFHRKYIAIGCTHQGHLLIVDCGYINLSEVFLKFELLAGEHLQLIVEVAIVSMASTSFSRRSTFSRHLIVVVIGNVGQLLVALGNLHLGKVLVHLLHSSSRMIIAEIG